MAYATSLTPPSPELSATALKQELNREIMTDATFLTPPRPELSATLLSNTGKC